MSLINSLDRKSKTFKVVLDFLFILIIGILDKITNYEFAFPLLCIIPIFIGAWLIGKSHGVIVAIACTVVWVEEDLITGNFYFQPWITLCNALFKLTFFLFISLIFSSLKNAVKREKALARTDFLTGAINSRYFYEILQMEIDRKERHDRPFTLAYIDLDNFKKVNDQFGHPIGDKVLKKVVNYAKRLLRKTDVLARLGGDEFALLLPETRQKSASIVIAKLQEALLKEMCRNKWPITFSIGVLTCQKTSVKTIELIKLADDLMYSVKENGKNGIKYSTYSDKKKSLKNGGLFGVSILPCKGKQEILGGQTL